MSKLRNIRSTFNIAPSIGIDAKFFVAEVTSRVVIDKMKVHIERLARVENLEVVSSYLKIETGNESNEDINVPLLVHIEKGSVNEVVGNVQIVVPLEGLVDFEKEKTRLEGNVTKLSKELEGLQKRLSNADFVARAAVEVVTESRARAAELEEQIAKLNAMISAM